MLSLSIQFQIRLTEKARWAGEQVIPGKSLKTGESVSADCWKQTLPVCRAEREQECREEWVGREKVSEGLIPKVGARLTVVLLAIWRIRASILENKIRRFWVEEWQDMIPFHLPSRIGGDNWSHKGQDKSYPTIYGRGCDWSYSSWGGERW